jgi:hypothetical protein
MVADAPVKGGSHRRRGMIGAGQLHEEAWHRSTGLRISGDVGGLLIAAAAGAVSKPHITGRNAGLLISAASNAVSKPHMGAQNAGLLIAAASNTVSKPHMRRARPRGTRPRTAGEVREPGPTATAHMALSRIAGLSKNGAPAHVFAARLSQIAGLSKSDFSRLSGNAGLSKNLVPKRGFVEIPGVDCFRHPRILEHGEAFSLQGGPSFRQPRILGHGRAFSLRAGRLAGRFPRKAGPVFDNPAFWETRSPDPVKPALAFALHGSASATWDAASPTGWRRAAPAPRRRSARASCPRADRRA